MTLSPSGNNWCLSRVLLACLLTLAASGDDFNLVRLIHPAAYSGSGPLDDSNEDFLVSRGSTSLRLAEDRWRRCAPLPDSPHTACDPLLADPATLARTLCAPRCPPLSNDLLLPLLC